ncbi:recombinase family protein [Pseudomonas sp. W5-36]|uniref:recombinase family protein n=1 Tax=Pseudomonas sp. W5-36 TaxID=3097455 RepID=UPI00397B0D4D
MATFGYIVLSGNKDKTVSQACDIAKAVTQACGIGKLDDVFVEEASNRSVSILKRPKFLEVRRALSCGDTFVIAATDILGTNPKELLRALQSLSRKGVSVVLARARVTLDSPDGKAYMVLLRSVVKMQVRLQRLQW